MSSSLFLQRICLLTSVFFVVNIHGTAEYETFFHIFSRANIDRPVTVSWTDSKKWSKEKSLQTCPIKVIAHGYAERWNMDWRWDWVADMKNEILSNRTKENYCVIAVDWEKGAREANFITAVANADIAGYHLADFIQNNKIDPKRLHCIGFSLGAHLCAFASNNLYYMSKEKKQKFARITGLDPSGPLLRKASVEKRLSLDDADLVDCIHTSRTFGLQEKSGHMDFFPDGGKSSASGCEKLITIEDDNGEEESVAEKRFFFSSSSNKDEEDDDGNQPKKNFIEKLRDQIGKLNPLKKVFLNVHAYIGCNHLRSPHYFIASINHCPFRAKLCTSWSDYLTKSCRDPADNDRTYPRMGFYADQSDRIYQQSNGSFYLRTSSTKPFCSPDSSGSKKAKKELSKISKWKKKLFKAVG